MFKQSLKEKLILTASSKPGYGGIVEIRLNKSFSAVQINTKVVESYMFGYTPLFVLDE